MMTVRRRWIWATTAAAVLGFVVLALVAGGSTGSTLRVSDAVLLGAIEGVTEFLPVSSTGHLLVSSRLLGISEDSSAVDSFTIVIQAGAIAAVAVLYRRRFASIVAGTMGRDQAGLRLGVLVISSFVPAALVGVLFGDAVKASLFAPGPVAAAWIVGGAAMLVWSRTDWNRVVGRTLDHLDARQAVIIGLAQTAALWPGVSRSLVTILAGIAVGLSLSAAVEYSFLLGALTLSAAAAYEAVSNGPALLDDLGAVPVAVGALAALVTAVASVRWLVGHLDDKMLQRYGWYRLVVGGGVVLLLILGVW